MESTSEKVKWAIARLKKKSEFCDKDEDVDKTVFSLADERELGAIAGLREELGGYWRPTSCGEF